MISHIHDLFVCLTQAAVKAPHQLVAASPFCLAMPGHALPLKVLATKTTSTWCPQAMQQNFLTCLPLDLSVAAAGYTTLSLTLLLHTGLDIPFSRLDLGSFWIHHDLAMSLLCACALLVRR